MRSVVELDTLGQLVADGIAAVLDGDDAGPPAAGDDGDGFPGVAAQGEQEGIHLLVIGLKRPDQIFPAQLGVQQCHSIHLISQKSISLI